MGDAVYVDLGGGKNLVALLAHIDKKLELDGINYVALRAYTAAAGGKRVSFNEMNRQTGIVPVTGALIPVLVTFADPANPGTARNVQPDEAEAVLGKGYRLHGISAEVVPNGFWPLDFGGVLGEPVTRGIQAKLPWLNGADNSAATALRAAGLPGVEAIDAREAFTPEVAAFAARPAAPRAKTRALRLSRRQACRHGLGFSRSCKAEVGSISC